MSKAVIKNYSFSVAGKTITLTDISTVRLDKLALITDVTTNKILYNFADSTVSTATVATNVITLSALQGGENNADKLRIDYDVQSTDTSAFADTQQAVTNAGTFPVQLNAYQTATTGSITTSTTTITATDLMGLGGVTVSIFGTHSGINVTFEQSTDGTTWANAVAISTTTAAPVAFSGATGVLVTNSTNIWNVTPLLGVAQFRVRATAFGSGSGSVRIDPSAQFAQPNVASTLSDGTNLANVISGDTGLNGVVINSGVKTIPFTTSVAGAQTLLANTDTRGYSWIEIIYSSVGVGLSLTAQYSMASGGTYNLLNVFNSGSNVNTHTSVIGTTINLDYAGPIKGNFFQLVISALTSGTFAGTVVLRSVAPGVPAVMVNTSSTTGAAVPTNAFFTGMQNSAGNLTALRSADVADGTSTGASMVGVGVYGFNNTNYDKIRNNTTGAIFAAGATTAQTSTTQVTYNAKRLHVVINISAFTSGTLTFTVNAITSSGYTYPLLISTALASTGITVLKIFDGATPTANLTANDSIPRSYNVVVTGTFVATYGVDYGLGV